MTIEALEQAHYEIVGRAQVKRSLRDIVGAEMDELLAEKLSRMLAKGKHLLRID